MGGKTARRPRKNYGYVLVIKLFDLSKKKKEKLAKENRGISDTSPAVAVCIVWNEDKVAEAERATKKGDMKSFGSWVKLNGTELLRKEKASSKIKAYEKQDQIVSEEQAQGRAVDCPDLKKDRRVYVIELKETVWKNKPFRKENDDCEPRESRYFYVGQTSRTPKQRYDVHTKEEPGGKKHPKASSIVFEYHMDDGLRSEVGSLEIPHERLSQVEALRREREVADRLRRRGFAAYCN